MEFNFLSYILTMLFAGAGSFGGGIGGINIMKEFALNWVIDPDMTMDVTNEILNITSVSQYGGYTQGITLAVYLGSKTELGIFGGILGAIAFILPSVLFVIIILKIGERLYKNNIFKYSVNYINLLAAGLICMIVWNYTVTVFGLDLLYPLVAGFACFLNIYFKVNPVFIVIGGAVIGAVWRA
ncbi:MAG: chromate transporter [Oscillospiraceae bacterium]|nr:chromate transporter [Oscillospiraceae bacterium]